MATLVSSHHGSYETTVVMSVHARQAPESWELERQRLDSTTLVPVGLVLLALVGLGASNGGYFPSSWGWSALVFAVAGALALLVRERIDISRLEVVYLASFAVLFFWTALSLLWTSTVTATMLEVERTLSYATFAVALILIARRVDVQAVLAAALVAITALTAYGLATRLLPSDLTAFDPIGGNRLSEPLGYWNALAALTAIGSVLAVGFAARARSLIVRGLSAAALVVLLPTLYFTFSRGGWIALFAGLILLIALDPSRLQLMTTVLVAAPWPILALWASSTSKGLTTLGSSLSDARSDGRRLLVVLAVLAVAAFAATIVLAVGPGRVAVGPSVRHMFGSALVVVPAVVVVATVIALGGPTRIYHKAVDSVRTTSPDVRGDQTQRLFSLSSHGRLDLWSSAVDEAKAHPVLGAGAGAFEQWWYEHRPVQAAVRDAHNLYLETTAELGLVGLAALLVLVVAPLAAAVRARRQPFVPVACAGWVVYLVHAAVDWDWEMPALTLAGLTCAGVVLVADRRRSSIVDMAVRFGVVGLLSAASVLAFVGMNGNRALTNARAAFARDDLAATVHEARKAGRWAPWSSEPLQLRADAAIQQGRLRDARDLYRRAISKDRENWELWLGLALASHGHVRSAALAHAERLNPLANQIRQLRLPRVR